jgi:hypothetical protein
MKAIAVTFEHNHSDLSDIWENYYSQFMDTEKIPIGDILRNNWAATVGLLNSTQPRLFANYDLILYADVDEIVIPNPDKYKDLGEYLEQVDQPVVRCLGYNVIQLEGEEPIDLTKPILSQRKNWSRDKMYDKFVIITKPQHYTSNHHIENPVPVDPDLFMLHLRDIDIDMAKARNTKVGANFDTENVKYRRSIAEPIPDNLIKQYYDRV